MSVCARQSFSRRSGRSVAKVFLLPVVCAAQSWGSLLMDSTTVRRRSRWPWFRIQGTRRRFGCHRSLVGVTSYARVDCGHLSLALCCMLCAHCSLCLRCQQRTDGCSSSFLGQPRGTASDSRRDVGSGCDLLLRTERHCSLISATASTTQSCSAPCSSSER